ncbi:MAG: hypothetical protein ACE15B_06505 [Bryobacteraceae bacterium]
MREVELQKHLAVRRAAESLDLPSWLLLCEAQAIDGVRHPPRATVGQALSAIGRADAISRLLDLGALTLTFTRVTEEMLREHGQAGAEELVQYRVTPFGAALARYGAQQQGLGDPAIQALMERELHTTLPE